MGKIVNAFIKMRIKYGQWRRRQKLKYKDFSIISNNCWAGTAVYQPFGLKYNTPTVGLFFMDEDYVRFLEKLEWYVAQPLEFISAKESRYYQKLTQNGGKEILYPIALIGGDVEIHFMHYSSQEEALEKWNRRIKRINWNRLIVKMSIRDNGYDIDDIIDRFTKLPYKNKVCFTPKKVNREQIVFVPELHVLNILGGDETECTLKHINLIQFVDSLN